MQDKAVSSNNEFCRHFLSELNYCYIVAITEDDLKPMKNEERECI